MVTREQMIKAFGDEGLLLMGGEWCRETGTPGHEGVTFLLRPAWQERRAGQAVSL